MPRTSYKVYDNHYPYFITNNIVDWLPVFSVPGIVAIVLDSLLFLQNERKVKLFSYVIMENHIHLTRLPVGCIGYDTSKKLLSHPGPRSGISQW